MLAADAEGKPWSVERRFRVTEVFLAVLWVCAIKDSFFGYKRHGHAYIGK